jgi:hypothetical protein
VAILEFKVLFFDGSAIFRITYRPVREPPDHVVCIGRGFVAPQVKDTRLPQVEASAVEVELCNPAKAVMLE